MNIVLKLSSTNNLTNNFLAKAHWTVHPCLTSNDRSWSNAFLDTLKL